MISVVTLAENSVPQKNHDLLISKHFQELNKERAKAAATIKQLQEKAEEDLKMELERKV